MNNTSSYGFVKDVVDKKDRHVLWAKIGIFHTFKAIIDPRSLHHVVVGAKGIKVLFCADVVEKDLPLIDQLLCADIVSLLQEFNFEEEVEERI